MDPASGGGEPRRSLDRWTRRIRADEPGRHVCDAAGRLGILAHIVGAESEDISLPSHLDRRGLWLAGRARACFAKTRPISRTRPIRPQRQARTTWCAPGRIPMGFPTVVTNCSNNYGPYQFPEKLIPLMILNALEGKPLPVYGRGENIRDWLYVDDHADALLAIVERGRVGESYNIGGNSERRNIDVVHTVCDLVDELAPGREKGLQQRPAKLCRRSARTRSALRDRLRKSRRANSAGVRAKVSRAGCGAPCNGISKTRTGGATFGPVSIAASASGR